MFRIYDGRDCFFQWDFNQKLIVEDSSINEVHFYNHAEDCALVCEVHEEGGLRVVNVPNVLLQEDWQIRVYAYCEDYTKIEERFNVIRRSKPADYIYTETEVKSLENLMSSNAYKETTTKEVFLQKELSTMSCGGGFLGLVYDNVYTVEAYNSNGELVDTYDWVAEGDWYYGNDVYTLYLSILVDKEADYYLDYIVYDGVCQIDTSAMYGNYHTVENLIGDEAYGDFTVKITGEFISPIPAESLHLSNAAIYRSPYPISSGAVAEGIGSLSNKLTPIVKNIKLDEEQKLTIPAVSGTKRASFIITGFVSNYCSVLYCPNKKYENTHGYVSHIDKSVSTKNISSYFDLVPNEIRRSDGIYYMLADIEEEIINGVIYIKANSTFWKYTDATSFKENRDIENLEPYIKNFTTVHYWFNSGYSTIPEAVLKRNSTTTQLTNVVAKATYYKY